MNKKTIAFWLIYAAVLVVLYILSATNLIIKEKEVKVYPVSVLLDGISGENFENMKKGMDEAAYEYNIDMSFPAIAENITMEEESEIAGDAIEAGAKALIIGNRWNEEIAEEIRKKHPEIPVLIVGETNYKEEKADVYLNYDNIVKLLSENIRSAESINNEACIVAEDLSDDEEVADLAEKLKSRLETMGYKLSFAEGEGPKLDKQLKTFNKNQTIFIAIDKESAVRLVKYAGDNNLEAKIYTIGATDYLLGKLEDGEIAGMVAWNEYDMGYLLVEKLMKMLIDNKGTDKEEIEAFYITAKDLKNEDYIKRLYPING